MVVWQGLWMALFGVSFGLAGAWALNRFLTRLLYGVKPTDPIILISVCLLLVAVTILASYNPARRAMKLDPVDTLKYI
jgi:putative ABC transport system permease protein